MSLALWVVSAGAFAASQESLPGASPAFPSLSVVAGARPEAMGESFTAVSDDASALFFNPAGLAWLPNGEISAMHVNYLKGSTYDTAAYATPFSRTFGFGLHFSFLNYGSFDRLDNQGNLTGSYTARDLSAGAGVGWEVMRNLSVGLHSSWISQTIDNTQSNGLWWDAGILAHPVRTFRLGLALKNMGVAENGGAAPFEARWGVAWRWSEDKTSNAFWIAAGAALVPHGNDKVNLGLEVDHQHRIFFRAGWAPTLEDNGLSRIQGLSFGLGADVRKIRADYAFTLQDKLGETHRFTLSFLFPGKEPAEAAQRPLLVDPTRDRRPIEPGAPSSGMNTRPAGGRNAGVSAVLPGGASAAASPGPVTLTREATPGKNGDSIVQITFKVEDIELLDAKECLDRARKLEKQGEPNQALKYCLAAVDKDPKLEAAWIELGQLQVRMGLAAFDEALKLNPKNEYLRRWLQNQRGK